MSTVAGGPLDHMSGLDDVGSALVDLLATLAGDEFAELVGSGFQFLVDIPEILRAVRIREVAPLVGCFVGGPDCAVDIGLGAPWELAQRFARCGIATHKRLLAVDPLAVDIVCERLHTQSRCDMVE